MQSVITFKRKNNEGSGKDNNYTPMVKVTV